MILLKIFELLVSFCIYNCLYHVFSYDLSAALLRAFEDVALPRFLDLIIEEVFIGVSAILMSTFRLSNEKFADRMINIANFAKLQLTLLDILDLLLNNIFRH